MLIEDMVSAVEQLKNVKITRMLSLHIKRDRSSASFSSVATVHIYVAATLD
ncbi:MAG: hypothetical protein HGB32_09855 [Geobacteraceae bacterium]|nr:hypothetical protein [Geobacteraceae bacterium]NTW80438.1 hypothetical protein [Geobacteraceae bacterium]